MGPTREVAVRTTLQQREGFNISRGGGREMIESHEAVCKGCGVTGDSVRLESCTMCRSFFCSDCAHRAGFGRRYCSSECTRAYYFAGQPEDEDDDDDD
jgi:hypothetical protein